MNDTSEPTVTVRPSDDPDGRAFPLVGANDPAAIRFLEGRSVVGVAATDFRADVERVTGRAPSICGVETTAALECDGPSVVVGTYGTNDAFDRVVDERVPEHGLDAAPERYALAVLDDVGTFDLERALVVAGGDPRGTAYGVYELSARIGVSPWYWWAEVPAERRDRLYLAPGIDLEGPPSVRYRGIFLNDEDFGLRPWATETFEPESSDGIGPKTYARVFELLLRLKGNTIWPAMHGGGEAFYRVEGNREAADRYGILVGTSHCEPMHRNNVEEWDPDEDGEWNYATNAATIREYWAERIEEVADAENIFTIGMRGIHDSGMPGGETLDETTALLQRVIDDQRDLLAEYVDPTVESIPQVFCPYKEVLEIYRNGLEIPEDVCFVWPNDNFGYVRRLPTATERERSGGHGIYYHLSYWGRPHDHQWLCSTPPALIREELRRAYAQGARELWIANVGDLKPAEKETEYFFDLAWDVEGVARRPVRDWLEGWASREFGSERAAEIAEIVAEYHRLALARKPEHMGWNSVYPNTAQGEPQFSAIAEGDEARRRLEAYEEIDRAAAAIAETLPESRRTAFFHLVAYPVRCAHSLNRAILDAMRSRLYAGQGRTSANAYADRALAAHDRIRAETERYGEMVDGKWRKMLSASPRDLPVFDPPPVARLESGSTDRPALGVTVEGAAGVAGTTTGVAGIAAESGRFQLPEFVAGVDRARFVDVYNRGGGTLEWTAEADEEWLAVSATEGALDASNDGVESEPVFEEGDESVRGEERIRITVDWDAAPDEPTTAELRIAGAGRTVRVDAPIRPRATPVDEGVGTFLEVDGRVAIEAEHATSVVDGDHLSWEPADGLSRTTGTAMATRPIDGPRLEFAGDGARGERATLDPGALEGLASLEYEFEWRGTGESEAVTVEVQLRPTHAPDADPLRFAVAIDDEAPTVVAFGASGGEHDPEWQRDVLRGTAIGRTCHDLEPGRHTVSIFAVDPAVVLDRLVVRPIGADRRSYLGPRETRSRRDRS